MASCSKVFYFALLALRIFTFPLGTNNGALILHTIRGTASFKLACRLINLELEWGINREGQAILVFIWVLIIRPTFSNECAS